MDVESANTNNYRYERKFFISELTEHEVEAVVRLHPAMFSESYPARFVNNVYFDSFKMSNYFDNVDGLQDRQKVRIRWYGELFGLKEKPVLELKIKNGLVGKKESFPLVPFSIDDSFQLDSLADVFKRSGIPDVLKSNLISLEVSLLNRYKRKYFQSADGKYRITVDSGMEYYQVLGHQVNFLNRSLDLNNTVAELKYDAGEARDVEKISNYFPFRMTRSSKYVHGIERFYSW